MKIPCTYLLGNVTTEGHIVGFVNSTSMDPRKSGILAIIQSQKFLNAAPIDLVRIKDDTDENSYECNNPKTTKERIG